MSEMIRFESDYEYVLGNLTGNILNIEALFTSGNWTKEELDHIAAELETAGHQYAASQGLGGTRLDSKIKATNEGDRVRFFNEAMDEHERYYAGHVEYGHHNRDGTFVPARPFMRPAVYTVAEASMGRLTGVVRRYLEAAWTGQPMQFGHLGSGSSYQRAFYRHGEGQYLSSKNENINNLPGQIKGSASISSREYTVNRRTGEGSAWFSQTEGWRK